MALGRGLGDILEEMGRIYEQEFETSGAFDTDNQDRNRVEELPVELIEPNPYQPRKHFDKDRLNELAQSIKKHGLIQPIIVIPAGDKYILIAGERRLRASKIASLSTIKALVVDKELDEKRLRELALIENIQREDLNPIELAKSYKELITVYGITHEKLASIIHKSRTQITNTLRLLSLDDYTIKMLEDNKISQGHGKILVSVNEKDRRQIVDTIIGQKLSVRETEKLIQNLKKDFTTPKKIDKSIFKISNNMKRELKELLSEYNCKIKSSSIEFHFNNEDEYKKFVTFIKKLS